MAKNRKRKLCENDRPVENISLSASSYVLIRLITKTNERGLGIWKSPRWAYASMYVNPNKRAWAVVAKLWAALVRWGAKKAAPSYRGPDERQCPKSIQTLSEPVKLHKRLTIARYTLQTVRKLLLNFQTIQTICR